MFAVTTTFCPGGNYRGQDMAVIRRVVHLGDKLVGHGALIRTVKSGLHRPRDVEEALAGRRDGRALLAISGGGRSSRRVRSGQSEVAPSSGIRFADARHRLLLPSDNVEVPVLVPVGSHTPLVRSA